MTFGAQPFQNVGFGNTLSTNSEAWAMFGTPDGSALYARINLGGGSTDVPIPGSWLGSPHTYRIEWLTGEVRFYIDGVLRHTAAAVVPGPLRPVFSDYNTDGSALTADNVIVTALPTSLHLHVARHRRRPAGGVGDDLVERNPGDGNDALRPHERLADLRGHLLDERRQRRHGRHRGSVHPVPGEPRYQRLHRAARREPQRHGGKRQPAASRRGRHYTTALDTPLVVGAPGVLANDSDPDGTSPVAVLKSDPANGTVTLGQDGSFTYTPNSGFTGADSFTYVAADPLADSAITTVTIGVDTQTLTLLVSSLNGGTGTVSVTGAATATCPASAPAVPCTVLVPAGGEVTLTAVASGSSSFVSTAQAPAAPRPPARRRSRAT